ncbi:MAG: DUF4434 domain-containing protein [Clostridia bacterium]|nr:DUF4434 domain-containing protein [Clostridia bacterium]
MKKTLSMVLAVAMIMSCFAGISLNISAATEQRLNLNTEYAYSYPGWKSVSGDNNGKVLTDGNLNTASVFTVKNETKSTGAALSVEKQYTLFGEGKDPHFYVQNDFGFPSKVTKVELTFNTSNGAVLPKSIDIYASNDGYNYLLYYKQSVTKTSNGGKTTYTITFNEEVLAMGIKAIVYTEVNDKISMNELSVLGVPNENERILLSKGAKYEWKDGAAVNGFNADANKTLLTDGVVGGVSETNKFVAKSAKGIEPVSKLTVSEIFMDLGETKNVSEVQMLALDSATSATPQFIMIKYSPDGYSYYDLGQSYEMGRWGDSTNTIAEFSVMRNHTVKARYLKIQVRGSLAISEVQVFGSENPLAEPEYDYKLRNEPIENPDIAQEAAIKVEGSVTTNLSDNNNQTTFVDLAANGQRTVLVEYDKVRDIKEVALTFLRTTNVFSPKGVKIYLSEDGINFTERTEKVNIHLVASKGTYKQYYTNAKAKAIKIVVETSTKAARLVDVAVCSNQPSLPLYRGGFFQLHFMDGPSDIAIVNNTDYMWYILLKGMKELGMDYVVMQFGAEFPYKQTIIPSTSLFNIGYSPATGYTSKDPYAAVMEAAEKLGMKVFLGTMGTEGSLAKINELGGLDHVKGLVEDGKLLIKDMYNLYDKYESFAGYYLPDETCDAWLNQYGGLTLYRAIYKGLSDAIREIDPDRPIMICPAIWRSGNTANGENNLYNLVKPETEGGRPIVDIVAAQDCLGRTAPFAGSGTPYAIPDSIYTSYDKYIEAWARGVRKAGAQFWIDAEVFEPTYLTKRYADNLDSMEIASNYTNGTIVFDIGHYFTEQSEGAVNDFNRFDVASILSNYSKRYFTEYKELHSLGRDEKPIKKYQMKMLNYGMEYSKGEMPGYTTDTINKVENFELTSPIDYNKYNFFKDLKGVTGRYTLMWDDEYLYIAVKTNDRTDNPFSAANKWNTEKGDQIRIAFNKGNSGFELDNISSFDHGAYITITRLANDNWVAKLQDGGMWVDNLRATNHKMVVSKDKNGGTEIQIALTWKKLLGMDKAPSVGDMINCRVMYYDNGAVSSSNASYGTTISAGAKLDGIYQHYDVLPGAEDMDDEEPEVIDVVKNSGIQSTLPEENKITVTPKASATSLDIKLTTEKAYKIYADGGLKKEVTKDVSLNEQITRLYAVVDGTEDIIEIIVVKEGTKYNFADLKEGAWYIPYVETATSLGIIRGSEVNGKTLLKPEDKATRIEGVIFALRMLGVDSTQFSEEKLNFADYNAEGEWSANYVKAAVAL